MWGYSCKGMLKMDNWQHLHSLIIVKNEVVKIRWFSRWAWNPTVPPKQTPTTSLLCVLWKLMVSKPAQVTLLPKQVWTHVWVQSSAAKLRPPPTDHHAFITTVRSRCCIKEPLGYWFVYILGNKTNEIQLGNISGRSRQTQQLYADISTFRFRPHPLQTIWRYMSVYTQG